MKPFFCHVPLFYKALPEFHAVIAIVEMILGIVRLSIFFSPSDADEDISQKYNPRYTAAFAIDWISSIVPTLMGSLILLLMIIFLIKLSIVCCQIWCHERVPSADNIHTRGWIRKIWRNKGVRRFVALDCNFRCYRPRPKVRFLVRLGFLGFIVILRVTAIALYVTSNHLGNRSELLAKLCAFSLICVFLTFLLDLYHYCVWWHYTPYLDLTCCCCRSRKHRRYMPYILIGEYLKNDRWDNRSCTQNPCPKRGLEHIATFHYSDFKPQARWENPPKPDETSDGNQKSNKRTTYIGFHQTTPEAAINIVKSEFRPSKAGMLGPGTYFARSLDATGIKIGRWGGRGAWFIVEIEMGKVFTVEKDQIINNDGRNPRYNAALHRFVGNGDWHAEYDTCYSIHKDDDLDEFCIKNSAAQIKRWIVVITKPFDSKVERYGLDSEFDSTLFGCI